MISEPLIESDIQNISSLQPDGWPDIVPSFEYYVAMPFCNPVKFIIEDRIAGIGSANSFGNTAWLSHIIVHPDFRNRGIGGSIVDLLLNTLNDTGCDTVSLIATESGYPVYKKAGFSVQSEYVFLKKKEQLKNYQLSENIYRLKDSDLEDVLSLDKSISGEDRKILLRGKLKDSYIYKKNGETAGYYLPESGEGLIAADNEEAGKELMKLRISVSESAVLPAENSKGIIFLMENGFAETKRVKRMTKGKIFPWHPDKIFNRIGGNFG